MIAGFIIVGMALPLFGMTITPTRNAILGLTTDEKIDTLADKIDETKVATEQLTSDSDTKITELQSQVSDQQQIVDDQKKMIDSQSAENERIAKCADLKSKYIVCNNPDMKKDLKSYLNSKNRYSPDGSKSENQRWEKIGTENWNTCQDVFKQCD